MIYANEYGTVDLLSEQFLQSLKSDKGTIGVKLSGGADTALLLYLLAKEISERNNAKLFFVYLPEYYRFTDVNIFITINIKEITKELKK